MTATFSSTISLPTPPIKQAKLYINGQWRSASNGKTRPTISPINETAIAGIPEASVAQLIDAILRDEHRMFTVSTRADPTYGVGSEVVLGLPCIIGRHGIESRLVLPRNEVEQAQLQASATKLENAYKLHLGKVIPVILISKPLPKNFDKNFQPQEFGLC